MIHNIESYLTLLEFNPNLIGLTPNLIGPDPMDSGVQTLGYACTASDRRRAPWGRWR